MADRTRPPTNFARELVRGTGALRSYSATQRALCFFASRSSCNSDQTRLAAAEYFAGAFDPDDLSIVRYDLPVRWS